MTRIPHTNPINNHQLKRHQHEEDAHTCERWVLFDWQETGNALRCDGMRAEINCDLVLACGLCRNCGHDVMPAAALSATQFRRSNATGRAR
jgi:hypothetical protein